MRNACWRADSISTRRSEADERAIKHTATQKQQWGNLDNLTVMIAKTTRVFTTREGERRESGRTARLVSAKPSGC